MAGKNLCILDVINNSYGASWYKLVIPQASSVCGITTTCWLK